MNIIMNFIEKVMNIKLRNNSFAFRQAILSILLLNGANAMVQAQDKNRGIDSVKIVLVEELYGQRETRLLPTSISTVNSEEIERNTVLSFGNALYGRLPGLFVQQASGELGSDYPALYVRGKHTFTGSNAPLVLVDGFPRDFNTLNVEEVESVSVLKDAAATALYGMDGANGIILVTTKRGVEGKTRVGFKAEFGLATPTRLPDFYGSYDYASFYNMAEKNDGKKVLTYSDEQLRGYKEQLDNMIYPDVNWIDEAVRQATPVQNYSIDIRGGNKVAKFYVNLGYSNSQGVFKEIGNKTYNANNKLDRFNFRSNIDINVTKDFSVAVDIAGRLENLNSPQNSSTEIWSNLYSFHPNVAPIYVAPGIWGGTNTYRTNPLAYINDAGYRHTHRRLLQTNIRLNYDLSSFVKGMSIGGSAAFDNFYSVDNGYTKTFGVQEILGYNTVEKQYILSSLYGKSSAMTAYGPSNEKETRFNSFEINLAYKGRFGNHGVNAKVIGHTDSSESYLSSNDLKNSPDRRVSLSGIISYDYQQKYILDIAGSYGGGENFMRGKRFGFFPSIAGAWIVSSEKFMKQNRIVDFLKLRASVGLVGNQNVGGTMFGYRDLYTGASGGWGAGTNNGGFGGGYQEAAIGNPDLTWEKSLKTDIGIDMTLWKHWNVMFNYYYEYRTDILNSASAMLPTFVGASMGYINYGRVGAEGFEAAISFARQYKDVGFHAGLNIARQKNKILRMNEAAKNYPYLYRQGYPINQRFGLVCEGFYSEDEIQNRTISQTFGNVIPGSLKYKDINGDLVINSDDYCAIGKDQDVPEWELGLNLEFNYKCFYINANLQACLGRDVNLRATAPYATSALCYDRNISTWIKQPWTSEAAANLELKNRIDFPSLTLENYSNNFQASTFFIKNGDFLRLRSLEVGCKLPEKWVRKVRLQSVNIYLRGMNLFTIDHLGYFDPEVLEGYPVMKSYNIGVNLAF
ncbi:SusC/RagA family TonB-linked outer membrane protein [Bacteroides xylanisolvens]|uniref:SusC/RagA family TonB-linked outer membrane protein n=1 Tax=Bacteroides xylanisolvens TaxID=371601 RepID=UPI0035146104